MNNILRQNLFLILGLLLPLFLAGFILVIRGVSIASIPLPQHSVLYGNSISSVHYHIDQNNKLSITYTPHKSDNFLNKLDPHLYLYTPQTDEVKSVKIDLSQSYKIADKIKILTPPELAEINFSDADVSPDGYRFTKPSRNRGSIFTEIFVPTSARSRSPYLAKGNRFIPIPTQGQYIRSDGFIGWSLDDES